MSFFDFMNSFLPLIQLIICYIVFPLIAILFIISNIEEYRYKKYWNTKGDTKLYESLIWSKFLKEKPKKQPKPDKTENRLNIFKKILMVGVWLIVVSVIVAIIYSIA